MKDKNNNVNKRFFLLILCFMMSFVGFSQDNSEKHRTYLGMEYREVEGQKSINASLNARIEGERGRKKISESEIKFYNVSDTTEIYLGSVLSNEDGIAVLSIPQNQELLLNGDGAYTFRADFNGSSDFKSVSEEISIIPIMLELSFTEIDSIKNIVIHANSIDSEGNRISIDEEVVFYVPSQFNRLKIGEVDLEDGTGMIEFPVTLPGDSLGNLKIIAAIEESDDYGTIETSSLKEWGKTRLPVIIEKRRGLGDTDAPLWMVYTLIVLMSTVWFHYMYLFFVLYRIKQKGKSIA